MTRYIRIDARAGTYSGVQSDTVAAGLLQRCVVYGAPAGSIQKLQRVQNTAARIVLQAPRRSPAQPLLQQLHWRIDYKLAVLTHAQDPCHIHTILPQRSYPTSGIYTPTPLIQHAAIYFTDRLREHISTTALSDVVHPLSGTRWTLKHYTVALLVDLNADLKHCFFIGHLHLHLVARLQLSASAS